MENKLVFHNQKQVILEELSQLSESLSIKNLSVYPAFKDLINSAQDEIIRCQTTREADLILKVLYENIETLLNYQAEAEKSSPKDESNSKLLDNSYTSALTKYKQQICLNLRTVYDQATFDIKEQKSLAKRSTIKFITKIRKARTEEEVDSLFDKCQNYLSNLMLEDGYETGTRMMKRLKIEYYLTSFLITIVMFLVGFLFQAYITKVYLTLKSAEQILVWISVILSVAITWMLRFSNMRFNFTYNVILTLSITVGLGFFVMLHDALAYGYAMSGILNLINMICYLFRHRSINSKFHLNEIEEK